METDFIDEAILEDDDDESSTVRQTGKEHEKLIDSIVNLSGKKRKLTIRTEPISNPSRIVASTQISSSSKKIKSHQLLSSLKKKSSEQVETLKKQLAKVNKHQATLQQPLLKAQTEKAERIAAYDQEKKTLSKWDPIVEKNRTAETLNFPLNNGGVQFETSQEFVNKLKPLSNLEKDIAAILQSSGNNIQADSLLTQAERKIISKMDLLEAKQKLTELKKMRALVSYQQTKFRRIKKIKSKKFRRLVRKERQKQEEKDLQKLANEHPDKFVERLEQLERRRVEERSTLRHKNSTKWAKEKRLLAKFNSKIREDIEEQLKIGKRMSAKQTEIESDDEEITQKPVVPMEMKISNEIPLILAPSQVENESNPWLSVSAVLPSSEYSKPAEIRNTEESSSDDDDQIEVGTCQMITEKLQMPTISEKLKAKELNESVEQHQMNIQEAFADDDVLAEFEKEKAEIIDRDQPKPIDLSLPGWGEWAGACIPVNKRKKRRFLIKPKAAPPRRDVHLQHVIINEKIDAKLSEHKVTGLPFPFANSEQFESIIKQPIGREWNPETAYRRLIQPKVRTRVGVRIEPLNKQEIFVKTTRTQQEFSKIESQTSNEDLSSNLQQDSLFDNEQHTKKRKFSKKKLDKS